MYRKNVPKNLNTAIVVVTDIDDNKQRGGKDKEARKKERKWRSKKHKVMGSRGKRR